MIFVLIAIIFVPAFLSAEDRVQKLAVMEFEDKSGKISKMILEKAAEYFRSEMATTNRFILISKERQMKELVKEQKKESYKECYNKQCQIPLGQALSADTIATGTIDKFGKTFTVAVEIIDLAKEATVKAAKAEFDGGEDSLKEAMDSILSQITGQLAVHKNSPDEKACLFAREQDDIDVWKEYLKDNLKGSCLLEAKTRIKALKKMAEEERAEKIAQEKEDRLRRIAEQKEGMHKNEDSSSLKKKNGDYELGDDTVKDIKSGLMWQRDSSGEIGWKAAKEYCQALTHGGFRDWRVPTVSEMRTIIRGCETTQAGGTCRVTDKCLAYEACFNSHRDLCNNPNCASMKGPGNNGIYWAPEVWLYNGSEENIWFWTSSLVSGANSNAWYIYFNDGSIYSDSSIESSTLYTRCVRSAKRSK